MSVCSVTIYFVLSGLNNYCLTKPAAAKHVKALVKKISDQKTHFNFFYNYVFNDHTIKKGKIRFPNSCLLLHFVASPARLKLIVTNTLTIGSKRKWTERFKIESWLQQV